MSKILLHIDEPCAQNWDDMICTEIGKFCNSCNKEVVDFTSFTNAQIVKNLKAQKSEKVCGQFYETQLNTWLDDSKLNFINPTLYKYLLSIVMITAGNNLQAQVLNKSQVVNYCNTHKLNDTIKTNIIYNKKINGVNINDTTNQSKDGVFGNTRIRMGGVRRLTDDNKPLLIVDGIIKTNDELSKLNPSEIKSVSVLKSPAAVAIYGPDGVNGAIIITTKSCNENVQKNIPVL